LNNYAITGGAGGTTLAITAKASGLAGNNITLDASCSVTAFTPELDGTWDGTGDAYIVSKYIKYAS
jgi:hypothetical protein